VNAWAFLKRFLCLIFLAPEATLLSEEQAMPASAFAEFALNSATVGRILWRIIGYTI
jgi:hypothetical protein